MSFARIFISTRNLLPAAILVLTLSACATAPRIQPPPSVAPGKAVETLQSEVTLSVKSGDRSIGGHGYLVFRRPDRFHLALLSPIGFTLLDVYLAGDRITCLVPSKHTAYQGNIAELPDRNALKGWGMMRWVIDTPPAPQGGRTLERLTPEGKKETLSYDERGLLLAKSDENGDRVAYQDYRDRNGVAFPSSIEMGNAQGDTVRIVFDEPEINQPLDEAALTPSLEGIDILPLAEFRGL
jgi:YD repeat-containing protein